MERAAREGVQGLEEYFGGPPEVLLSSEEGEEEEELGPAAQVAASITPATAATHTFTQQQPDGTTAAIGPTELYLQLLALPGVKASAVAPDWVTNHYKWVVWKLASYERRYPGACAGKALTADNVLQQLHHRYRHEIANGNRWVVVGAWLVT